jgi:hypothetical protein
MPYGKGNVWLFEFENFKIISFVQIKAGVTLVTPVTSKHERSESAVL